MNPEGKTPYRRLTFPWMEDAATPGFIGLATAAEPLLVTLVGRFVWEFHDLLIANQVLSEALMRRDVQVEEITREHSMLSDCLQSSKNETEHEKVELGMARLRETIGAEDAMVRQIQRTSERSVLVNAWILAESAMSESYLVLHHSLKSNPPRSDHFRWQDFHVHYARHGIVLEELSCYLQANQ